MKKCEVGHHGQGLVESRSTSLEQRVIVEPAEEQEDAPRESPNIVDVDVLPIDKTLREDVPDKVARRAESTSCALMFVVFVSLSSRTECLKTPPTCSYAQSVQQSF